jgi:hypothetical protein
MAPSFASMAMEQRTAALPWQQRSHAKILSWPVKHSQPCVSALVAFEIISPLLSAP